MVEFSKDAHGENKKIREKLPAVNAFIALAKRSDKGWDRIEA